VVAPGDPPTPLWWQTKWRPYDQSSGVSQMPASRFRAGQYGGGSYLREVSEQGLRQRQGLQDSDPFEASVWRAAGL